MSRNLAWGYFLAAGFPYFACRLFAWGKVELRVKGLIVHQSLCPGTESGPTRGSVLSLVLRYCESKASAFSAGFIFGYR